MSWLMDVGLFLLLFFVLVFVHELGHFWMARLMGIKVERFSLGMGPALFSKKWGDTEYRIALLPLGGYVKMAGDDPSKTYEGEEARVGFLTQPPPAKLLVVFGGPIFNLVLPIFVFGLIMLLGFSKVAPVVGRFEPSLPAIESGLKVGDRIKSVNGTTIEEFEELEKFISESQGQSLALQVERTTFPSGSKEILDLTVTPKLVPTKNRFGQDIQGYRLGLGPEFMTPQIFYDSPQSILAQAGFHIFDRVKKLNGVEIVSLEQMEMAFDALSEGRHQAEVERNGNVVTISFDVPAGTSSIRERVGLVSSLLVVGAPDKNSPAAKAGIQENDRIVSINGQALNRWDDLSALIKGSGGNAITVVWMRGTEEMSAVIQPEKTVISDPLMGKDNPLARDAMYRIGVPPKAIGDVARVMEQSFNPIVIISHGLSETWRLTSTTAEAFYKLFTGQLSLRLLGSPIMIFKVASNSYRMAGGGHMGWVSFLTTLALLSISLGLINLLPVPVLDGGHVVFFTIEWIRGRPVSLRAMEIASQFGVAFLVCLFAFVLYNDIYRYGWLDQVLNLFR